MNIASFFSGAGGLDLGFERAGFVPVIAYDNTAAAVSTYNSNRKTAIAKQRDLATVSIKDIQAEFDALELKTPIRGVIGGPPCQYFSIGNRSPNKDPEDIRRKLPITYSNLLKKLNAASPLDFFVFENVFGLAKPAHKDDFEKLLNTFEKAGFSIFTDILDAYDFGVPQRRKRVFIVGFSKKLYPQVDFKFPVGIANKQTVKETIGGLGEPEYFARNLDHETFSEHPNHWTMNPRSPKFTTTGALGMKSGTRSFRRLAWDEPSYTVAYGNNEIHVHPDGHRRLSIYEAMLLQGFPKGKDGYRLHGHLSEQVTLVSDAVPPPLSYAVAEKIYETMEWQKRKKKDVT